MWAKKKLAHILKCTKMNLERVGARNVNLLFGLGRSTVNVCYEFFGILTSVEKFVP